MRHIAFIIDGNGRWAEAKRLPRAEGHKEGAKAVLRAINAADMLRVPYISFYALSVENFKRSASEILGIFGAMAYFFDEILTPIIRERNYRIRFSGDLTRISPELLAAVSRTNVAAINNTGMLINICVAYGGRDEIARAFNYILEQKLFVSDFTPLTYEDIQPFLYTVNIPDPDAVIRFGGYKRLSNFMPLQTAYSELFFRDKLWPDVTEEDVFEIYNEFIQIKRNFGEVKK